MNYLANFVSNEGGSKTDQSMTEAKQVVTALFHQFTQGCNSIDLCDHEDCKSSYKFKYKDLKTPNEIANKCLQLAKEYQFHLCTSLVPTFLHPEILNISKDFSDLIEKLNSSEKENIDMSHAKAVISKAFSNPEYLMFLLLKNNEVVSKDNLNVDDELIQNTCDTIYQNAELFNQFRKTFSETLEEYLKLDVTTYHSLRLLLILPAFRFYFDDEEGTPSHIFSLLVSRIRKSIQNDKVSHALEDHFIDLPRALRLYVQICQLNFTLYLLITAEDHIPFTDDFVKNTVAFLHFIKTCSDYSSSPIKTSSFYNDPFSEQLIEYFKENNRASKDLFLSMGTVTNLETKFKILGLFLSVQQQDVVRNQLFQQIMQNTRQINLDDFKLTVEVRRDHLLDDAIAQFSSIPREQLYRQLQIKFKGEAGIDAGGVSREFFYLITEQLFSPDHGMFRLIDKRCYWFLQGSVEDTLVFNLIGTIVGLAIYNKITLPIKFPIVLFKKLKDIPVCLSDLREVDEPVYDSLCSLLDLKRGGGDVSDAGLTFVATSTQFDKVVEDELIANGAKTDVTNDNLEQYVELYIDWVLNKSIQRMFSAFKRGFDKLAARDIFSVFTPDELSVIVSGEEVYDWTALRFGTKYIDGYDENSRAVKWFWEIFAELTEKQRIDFLLFSTGTDQAPVGGLSQTNLVIQRSGDPKLLPVAHTCFNIFALPDYPDKETMKKSILIALDHIEGFGLK